MAKNTFSDEVKKKGKSVAKKSVKKGAKSLAKTAKDGIEGENQGAPKRHIALKIIPYCLCVLSIVLAVFFITVHVAEADAGFIGNAVQYALGGIFGGAALLVPIALGFFGVRWCVYNIKWREEYMAKGNERYRDYRKAKGRIVLQGIMICLVILTVSGLFGVFAGYDFSDGLDFVDMWEMGGEELFLGGGGILGSTLGGLLVGAVKEICSVIILFALLAVFSMLMFGLTPDYVVTKIRDAAARAKAEREEAAEEERLAAAQKAEQEAKEAKAAAARAAKSEATLTARVSSEQKKKDAPKGMSASDIANITEDDEPPFDDKAEVKEIKEIKEEQKEEDDIVARMFSDSFSEKKKEEEKKKENERKVPDADKQSERREKAPSRENGGDFGGEPGIDADGEFDPLEDIIKELNKATGEVTLVDEVPDGGEKKDDTLKTLNISELKTEDIQSDMAAVAPDEGDSEDEEEPPTPYIFPPVDLLAKGKNISDSHAEEEIQANARQLVSTLQSFKINIKDINCSRGPTITRYELKPEAGIRVRSIANLVDDISLSLATSGVRIEAPIPGKPAVGIEVPNKNRATVYLRDLIENTQFSEAKSKLTASLGMDVGGNPVYFDISKMPHMLIAGATGMGKSVCINCIIISLLYKARPEDLKLILIDPKKVEFNIYKDIPHLYAPIVSEPKKAAGALASAVAEMERRFELIEEVGVRDIASYNAVTENDPYKEHMPHMVIIIDELADLMMTAPDEVETAICRLAQKARAAGIHIIIGTQRPSVDVITGLIKANIPSRIACTVASQVDSRTIIDIAGAEKLIGRGDMLFAPVGAAKPMRVQGAFVTDSEVENIVTFIRDNNAKAKYNAEFINRLEEEAAKCGVKKGGSGGGDISPMGGDDNTDSKFQAAVKLAVEEGKISTSLMQRRLGVGYGRAAKIIDSMEEMGYVSKPDGNKPRRVLLTAEEYAKRVTEGTLGGEEV
ncbi:MAG: DNA translocase FtsK [Clostridia bacterium]|nr:DNA translocase FtsK [Paludibacteraceae bacterium]MBQ8850141.1 DNA translocase FtsK [Clostridia bacterium]